MDMFDTRDRPAVVLVFDLHLFGLIPNVSIKGFLKLERRGIFTNTHKSPERTLTFPNMSNAAVCFWEKVEYVVVKYN